MHLRLFHRTRSVVDGGVRGVARRLHRRTPSGRRYPPWRVIYERKVMLNVENRHWRVTIVCFYALTMLTTTDNPANIVPVVATVQMRVSWLYFGPCGRSHFWHASSDGFTVYELVWGIPRYYTSVYNIRGGHGRPPDCRFDIEFCLGGGRKK